MQNKAVKIIVVGLVIYALFAITVLELFPDEVGSMDWEDRQAYNQVQIAKLELGTTRTQILELMGSPDISEAKVEGDELIQVMFYRTHHKTSDGITTRDECTPLLFENDTLVAWGDTAYARYQSIVN